MVQLFLNTQGIQVHKCKEKSEGLRRSRLTNDLFCQRLPLQSGPSHQAQAQPSLRPHLLNGIITTTI